MFIPIEKCIAYRCSVRPRQLLKYSTGAAEKPEIQLILVELCSGEYSGFGEFYATSLNYPRGIPGTSSLDEWSEILSSCERLTGKDAIQLRRLIPERYEGAEDAAGIVDCLDFALHDLIGKARNLPAWALVGGRRRDSVPAMPVVHTDDTPAMVSKAEQWQKKWGIKLFKLKPHADFDEDIKMMRAFNERLAPGTRYLLDANYAYKSIEEAARTLAAVARFGVFLAEDPIESTFDRYREELRPPLNAAGVRLMLDQQARDAGQIFAIASNKAADVVNFHANWHSGFAGLLAKATVAAAGGMSTFMGSSIYAGVADAANILLSSVLPGLVACEQVRGSDFYLDGDSVVKEFPPLVDGMYQVSDRPGLGFEIDREKLAALTIERVVAGG